MCVCTCAHTVCVYMHAYCDACVYAHYVQTGEYFNSKSVCLFASGLCSRPENVFNFIVLIRPMQSGEVSASTAASYQ